MILICKTILLLSACMAILGAFVLDASAQQVATATVSGAVKVFNLFNITNVLGFSKSNYSGFGNVIGSSDFGRPITTAGGVFGSGGPRAFQFAAQVTF